MTRRAGGHIHDTWMVEGGGNGLVLQRLNCRVFPDSDLLTANMLRVMAHLEERAAAGGEGRALRALRADSGEALVTDSDGHRWRAFALIAGATAYDRVETATAANAVGRSLGRFVASIQDLPGPVLVEPIPHFKDFPRRLEAFESAVEDDAVGRAASCGAEIEAVRRRAGLVAELDEAMVSGRLPIRLVHNDAKAANVLLDDRSGDGVCVIDLDTVAPGVLLFDVGDLLRSATVTLAEDAREVGDLAVRDDLLEAALAGYVGEAGEMLTEGERSLIPLAGPLMAYENAVRFLTDHLAGDVYYGVARPRHNLDRARAQLGVVEALSHARGRIAELVGRG